jgi:hypothetical protein
LLTITNAFEGKNLANRFDNIVSIDLLEAATLADAIEAAVDAAEPRIGETMPRVAPRAPSLDRARIFNAALLADRLRQLRD